VNAYLRLLYFAWKDRLYDLLDGALWLLTVFAHGVNYAAKSSAKTGQLWTLTGNALASFRGIFLVYEGKTGFVHEESKFIRFSPWRNRLEAHPTDILQGEQHKLILGPMGALSIQDNPHLNYVGAYL
jgi:hypothetical protein